MSLAISEKLMAEHLSKLVTFPTVSNDREEEIDFSAFRAMHAYLKEAYPLVHQKLSLEIVGHAGLLYTWKGTGKSKALPLMLMAHQDVVPVGDPDKWSFPPFSGLIRDGRICGRGADDCKSNMVAQLETVEALLKEGFTPDYDLYLFYGYNEEVSGGNSVPAPILCAQLLEQRGIRLGGILDEGGGPRDGSSSGYDAILCGIGVAEKGYADFRITRKDPGGHSSRPHKQGGLYYIAKAILAIEENQYPYRIIDQVAERFERLAPYMTDPVKRDLFRDVRGNWEKLLPIIDADPGLAACFHTTMVPTMAQGSMQGNILPDTSSIVVNFRLLQGDTLASVRARLEEILPEGMEITLIKGNEASPFSEGGELFDLIAELSRERTEGTGKPFVALPEMQLGGTDAKFMYSVCDHVYRFSSFYPKTEAMRSTGIHGLDESCSIDNLCSGPWFYDRLLKAYGKQA